MGKRFSVVLLAGLACSAFAEPEVVFNETFDEPLTNSWIGQNGDGSVPLFMESVADPLRPGNKVAQSLKKVFSGDAFSLQTFAAGDYTLSFDYLGTCKFDCGGAIGYSKLYPGQHEWLAGTAAVGFPRRLKDNGKWQNYSIEFKSEFEFRLMFEQWTDSFGKPGEVYFDNIRLIRK